MGVIFRLISRLGLRWLIVSAIGRYLIRRFGRSTIERAGRDLEYTARHRLPAPMADAIPSLPPEAVQLGGSVVVAGRAAKGAVSTTRRASRLASDATGRTSAGIGAVRSAFGRGLDSVDSAVEGARSQLGSEVEQSRRRMRATYLEATVGQDAATDALLDARSAAASELGQPEPVDPHESVPEPVASGRRRHRRRRPPLVDRMRRSYRPPARPWD